MCGEIFVEDSANIAAFQLKTQKTQKPDLILVTKEKPITQCDQYRSAHKL